MSEEKNELITLEKFEEVEDFESSLINCNLMDCRSLAKLYRSEANKRKTQDDEVAYQVFNLLDEVTSISFDPTNEIESERFSPLLISNGKRTPIPKDYQGNQSEVFIKLVPKIKNLGLKARLADISWQNDRSQHEMAQHAINAYVEAVNKVLKGEANFGRSIPNSVGRIGCYYLMRALQIYKASCKNNWGLVIQKELVNRIAENTRAWNDPNATIMILQLSMDYKILEPAEIAKITEDTIVSDRLDIIWQRDLWKMAAQAYQKCTFTEEQNRCLTEAAECCVKMAENCSGKGINAAAHLTDAIRELRHVPDSKNRRQQLEVKLREAQAHIYGEMGVISGSVEVEIKELNEICDYIGRVNLPKAIFTFAEFIDSPNPDQLTKVVIERAEKNPMWADMYRKVIDNEGLLVSQSKGLEIPVGNYMNIQHLIIENENFRWNYLGSIIEYIRQCILTKHQVYVDELRYFVGYSCFIPENRKDIVAIGLMRYFCGDFVSALHILIPQLENSLRNILNLTGDDTSKINQDMTQEMLSLSMVLKPDSVSRNKLEELLGEAIIFEIDNLFNHRTGPSLRHKLLHGLCTDDDFKGCIVSYACWFIFRFCYLGLRKNTHNFSSKLSSST